MSLQPVPFTHALDEFLHDLVRALHKAVERGIAAARSDQAETDRALADCKDMIDLVMAGQVEEWVGDAGKPKPAA
ncbi:MAG: hypothetical protein KGN00_10250 [Chloroflexota bacterium]|nr:hypothetical protein [Chloroflexota bacterium]MDE3194058.1 hypothetical protein [Chloroflexota bacterium]